jgi:energy-converting hydrogenase Eha subunit G
MAIGNAVQRRRWLLLGILVISRSVLRKAAPKMKLIGYTQSPMMRAGNS